MSPEIFYVGTFGQSFYTIALDADAPSLMMLNETPALRQPDVFCVDANKQMLYIGSEDSGGHGGVSAFSIRDPLRPRQVSRLVSGAGPCHIALVDDGPLRRLVGSGYYDGCIQVFSLNEDGSIGAQCGALTFEGSGPYHNPNHISRQDHARMHCVAPIPKTPNFACADLGGDAVYVLTLEDGRVLERSRMKLRAGSGPRHIACAKSGGLLYLVNELDCCVTVFAYDEGTVALRILQRISAIPDDFTGDSWCSAIHLSPDERFLYVANRGHDSIAIFPLEQDGTRLAPPHWQRDQVSAPREFTFDRSGQYMLIGGMETGCVTLNRVNSMSGRMETLSALTGIPKPACIVSAGR